MSSLNVVIVWHMHQPDYRDPVSGKSLLPWTFLHAVKDYSEMLRTAEECPEIRLTFNIVPTLFEQIEAWAAGEIEDVWLELARRDPAAMSAQERDFLAENFFAVYPDRHIKPYPRYAALFERRRDGDFSDRDLRDLQVWFLLAWSGHHLRREKGAVRELLDKGEGFTEEDKKRLFDLYNRVIAGIPAHYRRLEEEGVIEISVTPYAHPILPLLCNVQTARQADPAVILPRQPFAHPSDARLQVRTGLQFAEQRFGAKRHGIWPSEGAVSEEVVQIMKEEGALWAASDEGILARSLHGGLADRRKLYGVYSSAGLPLLFRDRELSDRIGFVYAAQETNQAVDDLVKRLKKIAEDVPGGCVPLILDGENCWERYRDNGYPFLSRLYKRLAEETSLRAETVSQALKCADTPRPLEHLAPGSWINADFDIWIGNPEENRAWDLLADARDALGASKETDPAETALSSDDVPEAVRQLMRSEGSDWFWWFGDHHSTEQAETFDLLFRRHLEALYAVIGQKSPESLHHPVKPPGRVPLTEEPSAFISPIIDGRPSDYFEWLAAGRSDLSRGGAMHSSRKGFTILYFGYDRHNLYLRLDAQKGKVPPEDGETLEVRFSGPVQRRLRLSTDGEQPDIFDGDDKFLQRAGRAARDTIVEIAVPLQILGLHAEAACSFSFHLLRDGTEKGRWPAEGPLSLVYRGPALGRDRWYV